MGKSVKTVIGLGLLVASAGSLASFYLPFTVGGIAISYGSIASLVGLSLLGSALAPDIGDMFGADTYSGQKLQTRKDNTSAVPVVYGLNKLAGNIIWQVTNSSINPDASANGYNRDYWGIYSLAGHTIEDITKIFGNENLLDNKGSNIFTSEYTHIKWHNATSGITDINTIEFVTDKDGTTQALGGESGIISGITEANLTLSDNNTQAKRENLLDGTISGWQDNQSGSQAGDGWIEIDLGSAGKVNSLGVKFNHGDGDSNYIIYDAELQYKDTSVSPAVWTTTQGGDKSGTYWSPAETTYPNLTTITFNNEQANTLEFQEWRLLINKLQGGSYGGSVAELFLDSDVALMIDIPAETAFLAVHQLFEGQENKNTEFNNILVEMKGKKIRTIVDGAISTEAYSNNPAEIILDLLTEALAIDVSEIDIPSFQQSKTDCDANAWSCNIAFIQQANIQSLVNDVLSTCRGQIIHSGNKWKLKVDAKLQTSVATITDDDIINNSLSISMAGNQEIANKITVKYINPDDEWLSARATSEDTTLQDWDGQTVEKVLDIKGITNSSQAVDLAQITLNSMRYSEDASGNRVKQTPLRLSFSTTVKNAHLEVGDIISVDHDVLDRVRKFVILSTETDQSGLIQIATREYTEQHYKDSSGDYII